MADPDISLELYKLAVEYADRTSGRRATANGFFLTLNSALIAFIGIAAPSSSSAKNQDHVAVAVTAVAGGVLAVSWWLTLRSYRQLNAAKFDVIVEIERSSLPIHVFEREWTQLKQARGARSVGRYAELGWVERTVPVAFLVIYVLLCVRILQA